MIPPVAARCAQRRLVDRHFAARITPAQESELRAHLPGCGRCRRHYEQHMLYAHLVPGRPRMAERLAAGLGVRRAPALAPAGDARAPAPLRLPSRRTWFLSAAAAAACVALLVAGRAVLSPESEYGVRGQAFAETGAALEVYRVAPDGSSKPSTGWMSAGDELAFAYRNPSGFARLMVFGVDDGGDIYWFHPAWSDARQNPVSVPISAGVGPFELPEAIRHQVRGNRLRIVALFTNAALSVRSVEEAWQTGQRDPAGSARLETLLEVRR